MGKEINIKPLEGLLFDPTKIWNEPCGINNVECKTIKEIEDANTLYFYCFELGNVLVFYHKGKLRSNNLLELPISDIISIKAGSEKKRIGKKWITTIKAAGDTIVIQAGEEQVNAFKDMLDAQKEKQELVKKTKKITLYTIALLSARNAGAQYEMTIPDTGNEYEAKSACVSQFGVRDSRFSFRYLS